MPDEWVMIRFNLSNCFPLRIAALDENIVWTKERNVIYSTWKFDRTWEKGAIVKGPHRDYGHWGHRGKKIQEVGSKRKLPLTFHISSPQYWPRQNKHLNFDCLGILMVRKITMGCCWKGKQAEDWKISIDSVTWTSLVTLARSNCKEMKWNP